MKYILFLLIFFQINSIKLKDLFTVVYRCQIGQINSICPMELGDLESFNQHVKEHHTIEEPCKLCGYSIGHQIDCYHCQELYRCKFCKDIMSIKSLIQHSIDHGYKLKKR